MAYYQAAYTGKQIDEAVALTNANKTDIAKNKADIAKNKAHIEKNTADIEKNTSNVDNLLDIVDIADNHINPDTLLNSINGDDDVIVVIDNDENNEKLGIHLSPELLDTISTHTSTIATNTADIAKNTADIAKNTADIAKKQEKGDKGDSGKSLFLSSDEPFASYTLVDNTDMAFTTTLTANPTITIPSDFTGCIAGVEFVNKASATALTIVNNSGIAFAKFRTIVNGVDETSSRLAKTDDTHYSLTISKNSTIQSVFKATALGLDIDIREMDYKEES